MSNKPHGNDPRDQVPGAPHQYGADQARAYVPPQVVRPKPQPVIDPQKIRIKEGLDPRAVKTQPRLGGGPSEPPESPPPADLLNGLPFRPATIPPIGPDAVPPLAPAMAPAAVPQMAPAIVPVMAPAPAAAMAPAATFAQRRELPRTLGVPGLLAPTTELPRPLGVAGSLAPTTELPRPEAAAPMVVPAPLAAAPSQPRAPLPSDPSSPAVAAATTPVMPAAAAAPPAAPAVDANGEHPLAGTMSRWATEKKLDVQALPSSLAITVSEAAPPPPPPATASSGSSRTLMTVGLALAAVIGIGAIVYLALSDRDEADDPAHVAGVEQKDWGDDPAAAPSASASSPAPVIKVAPKTVPKKATPGKPVDIYEDL